MIWLTILLCLIWGFNWVIMKSALDYFPPVMFSAIRFFFGAFILFIICFYKKIPLPKKEDWKWYAICGLLQTTYVFTLNQQALQYIDAGITSLLSFTMPIWFAVFAHFFINERLTAIKIVALFISIIGLFFVLEINPLQLELQGIALVAQLFVLSGAVAWAISNIIVKKVLHSHNKWQFTTYQMVIGACGLLFYSLLFEQGQTISWSVNAMIFIVFSGGIASALAFIIWFYLLGRGEGGKASISLLLVPVVGVLSGWIFLGETLHFSSIFGILLILSGIGLVNINAEHKLLSTFKKNKKAA
ncbi:DMT family transporter [Anaerobacillus sp. MEB173]|uniref:DMT family transporter n=1 Tax=Anaerobacillus sp. MEB173 TaxID=3383345 RepID=UPI003F8F7374